MTDLVVPVLAGTAAAALVLLGYWYWQRRQDSLPGSGWSLAERILGRSHRPGPMPGPGATPPDASPVGVRPPAPFLATVPPGAPAEDGASLTGNEPARAPTGRTGTQSSGAPASRLEGPAPRAARPKRAGAPAGRSTIQLDPLDTPVDGRRARITVGALIDDLELAKLGRRT